jgi:hypothetical protein
MDEAAAGRVVVGVADTLAGYQALRYAVEQARQRQQPLIAVRALPPGWSEALRSVPSDVSVAVAAEVGSPADVLAAVANRADDLMVIGGSSSRDRAGPGRWWLADARGWRAARSRSCRSPPWPARCPSRSEDTRLTMSNALSGVRSKRTSQRAAPIIFGSGHWLARVAGQHGVCNWAQ